MENKEKEEKDKERMKNNNNPNPKKSSRFSSSFLSVPFFLFFLPSLKTHVMKARKKRESSKAT